MKKIVFVLLLTAAYSQNAFSQLRYFEFKNTPFYATGFSYSQAGHPTGKSIWLSAGISRVEFSVDYTRTHDAHDASTDAKIITPSFEYVIASTEDDPFRLAMTVGYSKFLKFHEHYSPVYPFSLSLSRVIPGLSNPGFHFHVVPELSVATTFPAPVELSYGIRLGILIKFKQRTSLMILPTMVINKIKNGFSLASSFTFG